MRVNKIIINPEGQREEIVVPLWNAIAEKICKEQVYPLYKSINDFIALFPLCAAESILKDFMRHLDQTAFLIDLNAATDKDGNIDWEYFFRYNDFLRKFYSVLSKVKENFKWSIFMKDYYDKC